MLLIYKQQSLVIITMGMYAFNYQLLISLFIHSLLCTFIIIIIINVNSYFMICLFALWVHFMALSLH